MRTHLLVAVMCLAGLATAADPPQDIAARSEPGRLLAEPFWTSDTMVRESLLFVQQEGASTARASLYFAPDAILAIHSAAGDHPFKEKVDFTWKPGSRELVLTPGSAIPFRTLAQMFPKDAPNNTPMMARDQPKGLGPYVMWSEGHVFHDLQVEVTYRHKEKWTGPVPASAAARLPRTMGLLRAKKPLTLVAFGDSITLGGNASGFDQIHVPPFAPPYAQQVAIGLEQHFGSTITFKNLAVGGAGIDWGVRFAPAVVQASPDLVLIAFGMNDTMMQREPWAAKTKELIDAIHAGAKDAEILLVSPMCGNPQWGSLREAAFGEFSQALAGLAGPGVGFADVTAMWQAMNQRKHFWDMTGNGVNHPNDFGHRLYAQVVLSAFAEPRAR